VKPPNQRWVGVPGLLLAGELDAPADEPEPEPLDPPALAALLAAPESAPAEAPVPEAPLADDAPSRLVEPAGDFAGPASPAAAFSAPVAGFLGPLSRKSVTYQPVPFS